ncbi:HEPN domain-containing protein [Micromonospora tulbaghiae]|uniref:HEPN domain-containing protein n=1 Tax=Micromonospora tulbaghiae TaxID=479978 RepID=UPI0033ADB80A
MNIESGFFWRHETPEVEIPGRLVTRDDGTTIMELAGAITPEWEVRSHDLETGRMSRVLADDPADLLVHGALNGRPSKVSLLGCTTTNRTRISARERTVETQTIKVGRTMRGAWLTDDALFTGVRLRVAGIDAWADLPGARLEEKENGGSALHLDPFDLGSVTTSSGAKLELDEQMVRRWRAGGETTFKRTVWVHLSNLPELSYRRIDAEFVTAIVGYLSFALGVSAALTSVEVLHDGEWIAVTHSGMSTDALDSTFVGQAILPLRDAGLGVLNNFLDLYRRVGPAIPITRDALSNERNATLDTQVLELTTVAEGLHRDLHPEQERMSREDAARIRKLVGAALKDESDPRYKDIVSGTVLNFLQEPNYKSRLSRLVEDVSEAMPDLCGDHKQWVDRANSARNSFAHRKDGFIHESLIDEMYVLSQSMKWLFWGVLLLRSGVPADVLREKLKSNQRYIHFLRYARSTVPTIYGSES